MVHEILVCVVCVRCIELCVSCDVRCVCGMVSVFVSAVYCVLCVCAVCFVAWVTSDLFPKFCLEDEYFLAPEMRARQLNSVDQKERLRPSLCAQLPSVAPPSGERPTLQSGFELLDLH